MKKTVVVLLRNRPFFGSRLTSLPALFYLRKTHPTHELLLIGRKTDSSFYSKLEWVNQVKDSESLLNDISYIPSKPEKIISFQPSSERAAIIRILKNPKISAGFYKNKNMLSHAWNNKIEFKKEIYRATHYLQLLQLLEPKKIDFNEALAAPFLSLSAINKKNTHREDHYFNVLLMPGGGAGDFKKWGHENFMQVAIKIREQLKEPVAIHVILGPDETKEKEFFSEKKEEETTIHYCPSLPELCRIVSKANIVIANDCGPSHIAQCLGKPFIGLYAHKNTEWFREKGDSIMMTPGAGQTIKEISVDSVLEACFSVIPKG